MPAGTEEQRYLAPTVDRGRAGLSEEDLTYAFNIIPESRRRSRSPRIRNLSKAGRCSSTTRWKTIRRGGSQGLFALKSAKPDAGEPRSLFGPPEMVLALPQARVKNGAGQTTKDLSDHPWAGADVTHDAHGARRGQQRGHQRTA